MYVYIVSTYFTFIFLFYKLRLCNKYFAHAIYPLCLDFRFFLKCTKTSYEEMGPYLLFQSSEIRG